MGPTGRVADLAGTAVVRVRYGDGVVFPSDFDPPGWRDYVDVAICLGLALIVALLLLEPSIHRAAGGSGAP